MVTFWNFDTPLAYLTVSLAVGSLIFTHLNISKWQHIYARFHLRGGNLSARTGIGLNVLLGLTIYGYLVSERLIDWDFYSLKTVISLLPIMILFSQVLQKSYPEEEQKTKPNPLQEKLNDLEERLNTAELTMAYTTRSLKLEQEKRKFEENKRKLAETKLTRLEQELLPQKHGLNEFNHLLCATQQLVNMGSWEWKPKSNELFWSAGVSKIHELGVGENITIRKSLLHIHPEYRSILKHAFHLAAEKGKAFDVEVKLITALKRTIWVRVVGNPVISKNEPLKIQGVYINIDHEKKSERALVDLTKNLSQHLQTLKEESANAMLELEEFSYIVSHDLRAPMRVIDGFSAILAEDYGEQLDQEGFETIQTIQANVSKMNLMMNEMLAFSAIGRKPIARDEINTSRLLSKLIEELNTDGISVKDDLPNILGDHAMITTVFKGLIDNAMKFAKKHGEHKIEIGCEPANARSMTRFYIKDHGIGFDMKFHTKVFKAFKKLNKSGVNSGVGMGLAITKKIIERHNGKIWAQSKANKGTTIYIELATPRSMKKNEDNGLKKSATLMLDFQKLKA